MGAPDTPNSPRVESDGNVTVVTFAPDPVRDVGNVLARQLATVPDTKGHHLFLNFTNVDYLNGVELGTLIVLHKRVRSGGGRLTLFNLAAHLRELFTVTRLDTVLTVSPERGENVEPLIARQ